MPNLKENLKAIFANDAEFISERDAHYKSSWKARGGVGAFFTIARPWDRFDAIAERGVVDKTTIPKSYLVQPYDIFGIIKWEQDHGQSESDDGTLQACIRDLRAYMALLAAEAMTMRGVYRRQPGVTCHNALSEEMTTGGPAMVSSPKEQPGKQFDIAPSDHLKARRNLETLLKQREKDADKAVDVGVESAHLDIILQQLISIL